MRRLTADDVHAALIDRWPEVLAEFIEPSFLSGKHSACPMCGGKDRWCFSNYRRRGNWICNRCGAGDGFALLQRVHGWDFATALHEVIAVAGLAELEYTSHLRKRQQRIDPEIAQPTRRVRDLLQTSCDPSGVLDVARYLKSRQVWPLPRECALRAHLAASYFEDGMFIGKFAAIVAPVVDVNEALVSVHVTYLDRGTKLGAHAPRKLLSKLTGRIGCAVRLVAATDVLGIAEGLESALSAMRLHNMPVWAALNAAMLAKFEPPPGVERLVVFADNDPVGLRSACSLRDRLSIAVDVRVPQQADWNDQARHTP